MQLMLTTYMPGVLAEFVYRGRPVRFFVRDIGDTIQAAHANGRFYEADVLPVMEQFLRPGGVFVDVGANVGNHTVFVAAFGNQSAVIPFELQPQAVTLLKLNVLLNRISVDTSHLGVGLSDEERRVSLVTPTHNLGNTTVAPDPEGRFRLVRGDSILSGRTVDFIKIDVEGHELAVLRGLERTIAESRPTMFIEVGTENRQVINEWLIAQQYTVAQAFPQYPKAQNIIVRPVEAMSPPNP